MNSEKDFDGPCRETKEEYVRRRDNFKEAVGYFEQGSPCPTQRLTVQETLSCLESSLRRRAEQVRVLRESLPAKLSHDAQEAFDWLVPQKSRDI